MNMKLRLAVAVALATAAGLSSFADSTVQNKKIAFAIEAQPMSAALVEFSKQSGVQVAFPIEDAQGILAPAVAGELSAHAALTLLLQGTGLRYEFINEDRIVTIRPVAVNRTGAVDDSSRSGGLRVNEADEFNGVGDSEQAKKNLWNRFLMAQADPGAASIDANKQDESPGSTRLEEIIVSATKREEPLQDIPMSVSVLDEQTLIKAGDTNLVDYAKRVPNLAFAATGGSGPMSLYTIQIRGVAGLGGGSTTGFYIDDVPIPESMNPRVMDTSRIEVLRGPQGTLYGTSSMGGTVRLITKRADPTTTEFKIHASLASVAEGDQDYAVDTSFNVPITSNLAFRGSLYYQHETGVHDIVVDNPLVAGDEVTHKNADEGKYWGLQATATWKPTEYLTVEPRFMYQSSRMDWLPFSDLSPDNFTAHRVIDRADPNEREWSISSLTVSWDTKWGRFSSATALLNDESNTSEEYSEFINYASPNYFGGDPNYYPPGGILVAANTENRRFTEEARFTSAFDGPLQLTAGVFYSKDKGGFLNAPCSYAVGFRDQVFAATGGAIDVGTDCAFRVDTRDSGGYTKEAAVFGELEYAVLKNLFLTLGGRYFDNTTESGASVLEGFFLGAPIPVRGTNVKHSEEGFNPKVALKWEVTPDWTLYSSAAEGYRIGGSTTNQVDANLCAADLAALGLSESPLSWKSDSVRNYEMGSKSAHANGRFALNATAFFIDWSDLMQTLTLPSCNQGFTTNTGKAEVKGAEVEIAGQAVDNLHYALGVGYTDAKIVDPQNAANLVKGAPIPQVPEWTLNANMDYRFNLGPRDGYFFLGYSWVDSSISVNQGLGTPRVRDAYGVVDARLGMTFGQWDVSLFGKNLANEHPNLSDNLPNSGEVPGRIRYVTNRPRTIGVDVRWAF